QSRSGFELLIQIVGSVFEVVSIGLFVPLMTLYMLIEKANLLESFNAASGKHLNLPKLNTELPSMLRAFVRGNLIGGGILFGLHAFLFHTMGLKQIIPLAFVSGFLNLIPVVGVPLALLF